MNAENFTDETRRYNQRWGGESKPAIKQIKKNQQYKLAFGMQRDCFEMS